MWHGGTGRLVTWYRENSRSYSSTIHDSWKQCRGKAKKISKRYGSVIETEKTTLSEMMTIHPGEAEDREGAWAWVLSRMGDAVEDDDEQGDGDERVAVLGDMRREKMINMDVKGAAAVGDVEMHE